MYIAIWLVIGTITEIVWTIVSVEVLGRNLDECFDTFGKLIITAVSVTVSMFINIVLWPVTIIGGINTLIKAFERKES